MVRKPRANIPHQLYHITSRGNNQEDIFHDHADRTRFLTILGTAKQKYLFLLYCYVLMDNHIHLLIKPSEKASISKIMQSINTGYTMYFNHKHKRCGHLFQGRFKSIIVEAEAHLLELTRYIHQNPVRAGVAGTIADYPFSSYHAFLTGGPDLLVDKEDILASFGARSETQINRFKRFVNEKRKRTLYNPERFTQSSILGSPQFRDKILKGERQAGGEV